MAVLTSLLTSLHGDVDKAYEWLDIAFKQKDTFMTQLIFNPWLVPLHDDPRWEVNLEKMKLLKYWEESQLRAKADTSNSAS